MKKITFLTTLIALLISLSGVSQTIREYNYNVNNGNMSSWYNTPGNIIYPTNYTAYNTQTPVVFVHGITGKVNNSYQANIQQVRNYNLHAAFVQLNPLGTPEQNGKLLKRMIDRITTHFNSATLSIVAHSKGGMDSERALYGKNPYNTSIPSFGFEKVDGVYTLSSPLRGSRVADVGSSLSWTGISFIAMWYLNGYQLTSGSVNSFHNWAKNWRINSSSTFKNYYYPNGASYSRLNMVEDNTTRWWAHQSDDACYQDKWYFCYVGNGFHHSAGAYYDAYWEWDWFDSGWRNWHSSNDGFIAEYRAKRSVITNASNALTPGAGDFNYRVMHSANHTSLWEEGENHFSREIAPYLHHGYYTYRGSEQSNPTPADEAEKDLVDAQNFNNVIMGSKGNTYFSRNGKTSFIVEEDHQPVNLIFYTDKPITSFVLSNKKTANTYEIIDSKKDKFTTAYQSVAFVNDLPKGVYQLNLGENQFVAMASYDESETAFAVNMHFNDQTGYNGSQIEVAIANANNQIDFSKVQVSATLNLVSVDGEKALPVGKSVPKRFTMKAMPQKPGHYQVSFPNLTKGAVYGLRVEALATSGETLLARNVINTFYVKNDLPVKDISVTDNQPNNVMQPDMISVYPNPTADFVNINLDKPLKADVSLFNSAGLLIGTYELNGKRLKIDVSKLSTGMYILKIDADNNTIVKQLMIK